MRESRSDPHPARNLGVFEHSRHATDLGKFCAPSLRNVAATVPYVHDGSIATALALAPQNKADLAAFLKSLTDTAVSTDRDFPTPLARDSTSFDNQLVP